MKEFYKSFTHFNSEKMNEKEEFEAIWWKKGASGNKGNILEIILDDPDSETFLEKAFGLKEAQPMKVGKGWMIYINEGSDARLVLYDNADDEEFINND